MVFLITVIVLITSLIGLATKLVELVTMVCLYKGFKWPRTSNPSIVVCQSMNAKGILATAKEMTELIEQLMFVLLKEQRELKQ